ncbi:MAG TPA: hypothetical protein VFT43_01915, partial [Candidatus Polarisedimenticolia bacterium]|nr:hypothetical protein [Candidatus Polarisedimenticolia bacterium]
SYKKIWPKMVAPSDLPGFAPFALNTKMGVVYSSDVSSGKVVVNNDFQFPQEVNIFTAGTLGEHFSFFGELTFGQETDGSVTTEIEHAQLHINSPFGPEHAVNFKIGKFAPDVTDGFQEMWLMTDNGVDTMFTYSPIGFQGGTGLAEDVGISIPAMVQGVEFYGVASHRLFYTVGITNGLPPTNGAGTVDGNSRKDVYARLDYKFGGMGLDGDTTGKKLPPENWRENSFRVGVLGYSGDGRGIDFVVTDPNTLTDYNQQDRRFDRAGAYVSWYFKDLNVFGVVMHGSDKLQNFDQGTGALFNESTRSFDAWFAQADYVIRPPFQVSFRYENLSPADSTVDSIRFYNANFSFLSRANIKTMLEYRRDARESENYTVAGVMRFAY